MKSVTLSLAYSKRGLLQKRIIIFNAKRKLKQWREPHFKADFIIITTTCQMSELSYWELRADWACDAATAGWPTMAERPSWAVIFLDHINAESCCCSVVFVLLNLKFHIIVDDYGKSCYYWLCGMQIAGLNSIQDATTWVGNQQKILWEMKINNFGSWHKVLNSRAFVTSWWYDYSIMMKYFRK